MTGHRVLIDATPARFGGTAYAMVRLADGLARSGAVERVAVAAREGSIVARGLPDDVRHIALPAHARGELARRTLWQATGLDRLARDATVVLTPSGMLPRRPPAPVVSYLLNPVALLDGGPGNLVRRRALARTSRVAAAVLVPTAAMAGIVREALGVRAEVVPLGVALSGEGDGARDGLLCVADLYRHKRHDLLLDAWERLPAPRPALRLIGDPRVDPPWARALLRRVASLDGVTHEHGLALRDLHSAYRRAALFVLPSERESFCMPLAEALRCGLPAVVRDIPALRETGAGGALHLAGDDPSRWAATIGTLLADAPRRQALGASALTAGARYSVDAMVAGVLAHLPRPAAR